MSRPTSKPDSGRKSTAKAAGGSKLVLKRRGGQAREKHAGLACYNYQKKAIKSRAKKTAIKLGYRDMSVSAYLNMLLFKDWL